jgi:hypothetical protein
MGFLSDLNRGRKKFTSKVTKPFVKAASKISQKFIPNELRFLSPYAGGLATLMLPPGMGPFARGLAGAGFNALGQIGADESETEDISDLNALSMALSGGLGALGSNKVSGPMRGGIEKGVTGVDQFGDIPVPYTNNPGFLQGAENVGREGIAMASDYVTGGRENLVNLGRNPGNLFSSADKFEGARNAMSALGPTVSLATGDVAYEASIDAKNAAEALDAEEQAEFDSTNKATDSNRASLQMTSMRQAGIPEDTVVETLEMNGLGEYYTPPTEEAAYGGLMGRNDYEFGGIIDAIKNIESREMMDQNKNMGGMMNGYNMGGSVLPQGMEMDYRQGGFIPMGSKERADDVPARVSKNEFVMTADAVRAAGGGSVNQGAKKMYDLMNNLEAKA